MSSSSALLSAVMFWVAAIIPPYDPSSKNQGDRLVWTQWRSPLGPANSWGGSRTASPDDKHSLRACGSAGKSVVPMLPTTSSRRRLVAIRNCGLTSTNRPSRSSIARSRGDSATNRLVAASLHRSCSGALSKQFPPKLSNSSRQDLRKVQFAPGQARPFVTAVGAQYSGAAAPRRRPGRERAIGLRPEHRHSLA